MSKIKFSIIGLGNIGLRHFDVIKKEENAEIVSICDIKKDKEKYLNDLYNTNIPFYDDYKQLLKADMADIISIATPHG